jgi:hypothetical protein
MSDDYREMHTSLIPYRFTSWLISKILIYLTIKEINIKFYISFLNLNWNANWLVSEYHTCDTSVGYPPGLTRERLISFARNTENHGFSQKYYSPRKRRNSIIHDSQLFYFTQRCRNIATFTNILFIDPVNSETTVNRTELVCFSFIPPFYL